jgi:5-formyltetrahydrofolate cyclo-ligase
VAGKVAADTSHKTALRRKIIAARDALPAAQRPALCSAITSQLLALDAYRNAACVLAYMSFGSEFDTASLIADALASGKQLCLPRVNRDTRRLELHRVEDLASDLQSGMWGIREPRADRPPVDLARIDFVLLPGVAFTPRCERLGYGGGFYDRLIPRFASRPPLVAAAFALQICDAVPLDANDQRVDVVITENAFYCNCG